MELADWLRRYGLEQYIETFAENDIAYSVLPDLTEHDLEKLGVTLGHRKTMLRAIEALTKPPGAGDATAEVANIGDGAPSSLRHRDAERRQLTVLFCDLVGSTELSQALDPEDLRTLIQSYQNVCNAIVARYDGHVAHFVGDGVMAFFGWPRAHEDDAIRAVYAALEILPAVNAISGAISGQIKLEARAGISTGLVVVGNIGSESLKSMDAVGETPNIAARLQMIAEPNSLVIAEPTKRLIGAAFECEDLGQRSLKGIAESLRVYRVHATQQDTSRFEAAHPGALTPLIGRSSELTLLLDRWQKAEEGDGQVVLLYGIPGVGKSRLIHELKLKIQQEPNFLIQYQCSPYHGQSAFLPVIEQIERAAYLTSQDSESEKITKIEKYLSRLNLERTPDDIRETTWLIANLLSIRTESPDDLPNLTPQQIKNRTLSKLVEMILDCSTQHPTLCIFEDVHWIDPSTLEFLDLTISRTSQARTLVIVSYRPEFRPTWLTHTNVTTHSLTRLSRREITGMVRGLSGQSYVPDEALDRIIEMSDGVPLFIEELLINVLASLTWPRSGRLDLNDIAQSGVLNVPETLRDSLMERLDRVPQGRRVAQIAAVIGRQFSYDLLSAVVKSNEADLRSTLSRLEAADIIHRVDITPVNQFRFKHALLGDAIYNSLLKAKRRQFHADIAAILEEQFRDIVENRPEIVAHHYSQADIPEKATHYWFRSGQRAITRSANAESIAHFRKALDALRHLPDTPSRNSQEIAIQLALGIPLIAVKGYPAEETRAAFARARELCAKQDNPREQFQALFGLWGHSWMSGKNDEAFAMAQEFLSRSQTWPDAVPAIMAHRVMGSTLLTMGDFPLSRQHFEKTIALSEREGTQPLHTRYMVEPKAAALLLLSWDLWFLGYPDKSLAWAREALSLGHDLVQPYTIAFAHYMASVVHLLRGEPALALGSAEKSLEISREQRFSLYELLSKISRGKALCDLEDHDDALTEIKGGIEEAESVGVGFMRPMMFSWLADAYAACGDHGTAKTIVEDTLRGLNNATGRSWESALYNQRARIVMAAAPEQIGQAESDLRSAIDVARRQNARSLEIQAANDLADLLRKQDRFDEARALLAPIYNWFTEGFETDALTRARAMQDEPV